MVRTAIGRAAWVLLAILAGVGGYAAGSRQEHKATIGALQTEAAGNLIQRIEVLSLLRMGEVATAIPRVESEVDRLTRTIALNPGADKRALAYVKTYLSVAPPSPSRAKELSTALDGVPVLDPGKCNTALRALLLSAKRDPAEQGK
jgi:hypothetical protein